MTTPPVIGMLCIDMSMKLATNFEETYESYLPTSYVKFMESAGALVVPIWIGRDRNYYKDIMSKLHGVLLPGGAVHFDDSLNTGCMTNLVLRSSQYVYELAVDLNSNGIYFPLWGTCLGFELMLLHSGNCEKNPRKECVQMNCALPLEFTPDYRSSILFGNLCDEMKERMENQKFGYHRHQYCITVQTMQLCGIDKEWKVLAVNQTSDNEQFLTVVEHKRYPFFGWQIHLEHACHEFLGDNDPYEHTQSNVELAQYFANLFVNECRKNSTSLQNSLLDRYLIWNFSSHSTFNMGVNWKECYLFPKDVDYPLRQ